MPNLELLEQALPVAPLKIAALESCREMGQKVNDYIVQFRRETLKEDLNSPLFSNYQTDNYLIECHCPLHYGRCLQLQPDLQCKWTSQPHVPGRSLPGFEAYYLCCQWKITPHQCHDAFPL